MSVRTMVCQSLDGPDALRLITSTPGPLAPDAVRIAVRAAGVNYPDLLMTRGAYQLRLEPPFTPGMEVAGTVIESGPDAGQWQPGARVIAMLRYGGYADQVVVPASSVVSLPDAFGFAEGATYLVAAKTAHQALVYRGRLAAGETLLVLGATGGVGLAAVELGHLLGARVIAVGSSDERLAVAREKGADAVVNYRTQDVRQAVEEIAGPNAVDVVYDPVGGTLSSASTHLLAWGGRLLVVGFASGEIPAFAANHALLKGYSIVGVRAGEAGRRDPAQARESLDVLIDYAGRGLLRPHVCATFPLEDAAAALHFMDQRRVVGRLALVVG
ncbi:NADPH:quinone oxidoreductase family protein [Aquisalimonas asiatica]|uniref:NADPH2:quinone reductase n=1 Tax=Aquisalimonas asiatica TaxID=406100 RepID=A0A1H8V1V5_9GAMM|nr:NADPH:quinone oxidoreductase family protein [Aquisalimonas asiatica]SEP09207.1 NADPH2:quinone reductase [Aquisalimonas asiatica]